MTEPNNIINDYTQVPDTGTWGSYNKTTNAWSNKVFSGKAIREWIQHKLSVYGPYESIQAACTAIPAGMRKIGLTVGVIDAEEGVVEYQWKKGIADVDLVKKVEDIISTASLIAPQTLNYAESPNNIQFQVQYSSKTGGRISIKRNGVEIEQTSILPGVNTYTVQVPTQYSSYTYSISIKDILGQDVVVSPSEFTVRVGSIKINTDLQRQLDSSVIGESISTYISVQNLGNPVNLFFDDGERVQIQGSTFNSYLYTINLNQIPGIHSFKLIAISANDPTEVDEQTFTYTKLDEHTMPYEIIIDKVSTVTTAERVPVQFHYKAFDTVQKQVTFIIDGNREITTDTYFIAFADCRYYLNRLEEGQHTLKIRLEDTYSNEVSFTVDPYVVSEDVVSGYLFQFDSTQSEQSGNYYLEYSNVAEGINGVDSENNLIKFSGESYAVLKSDGRTINPYALQSSGGSTIELIYNTKCVGNLKAPVLSTFQNETDNNMGVEITYKQILVGLGGNDRPYVDVSENTWIHATIVFSDHGFVEDGISSGYMYVYIDGCMVLARPIQQLPSPNPNAFLSLNVDNALSNYGESSVKLLRFYNQALSPSQVVNNYINSIDDPVRREIEQGKNELDLPTVTFTEQQGNYYFSNLLAQVDKSKQKTELVNCITEFRANSSAEPEVWQYTTVATQGTSTLQFPIKNFKVKVYDQNGKKSPKSFKTEEGWDSEYVYTLKCDYMESSHLNNTPTCSFYNKVVDQLVSDCVNFSEWTYDTVSPARAGYVDSDGTYRQYNTGTEIKRGYLDAIKGFPCVVKYIDMNKDEHYLGTYMFNLDKEANSLGFKAYHRDENGHIQKSQCVSIEGKSNTDEGAGSFCSFDYWKANKSGYDATTGTYDSQNGYYAFEYREYYNSDKNTREHNLTFDEFVQHFAVDDPGSTYYAEAGNANKRSLISITNQNSYYLQDFEVRYVYNEDIETDPANWHNWVETINFVSNSYEQMQSSSVTNAEKEEIKSQFKRRFNLNYCLLYYLQMIVFAQVDNAGKNCMWDTWDGIMWFPRPYDQDTMAGLDNSGLEIIDPDVEYNIQGSPGNYVNASSSLSGASIQPDVNATEMNTRRYSRFNTSGSRMWVLFKQLFDAEIKDLYRRMRNTKIYDIDNIIDFYFAQTSDIIGERYYNMDAVAKYMYPQGSQTQYLDQLHGNRRERFKYWITTRIKFCDSLFGYNRTNDKLINLRINPTAPATLVFKTYNPIYIYVIVGTLTGNGTEMSADAEYHFFCSPQSEYEPGKEGVKITIPVTSGDKEVSIFGADAIKEIEGIKDLNCKLINVANANKLTTLQLIGLKNLTSLVLGNNEYLRTLIAEGLTGVTNELDLTKAANIQTVAISGSTFGNLLLTTETTGTTVKTVDVSNTSVQTINIKRAPFLQELNVDGCSLLNTIILEDCSIQSLAFRDLNSLKKLNLIGCDKLTTVNISDLSYFELDGSTFSNCGSLEEITMQGVYNVGNTTTLSLESITNLKTLDISETLGIQRVNFDTTKLNTLKSLNLNLSQIVELNLPSTSELTYLNCNHCASLQNVTGLNANITNEGPFRDCYILQSITGSKLKSTTASNLFRGCEKLETVNVDVIDFTEASDFSYAFFRCYELPWDIVKQVLVSDKSNVNATCVCAFKFHDPNKQELGVVPSDIFNGIPNVVNLRCAFGFYNGGAAAESQGYSVPSGYVKFTTINTPSIVLDKVTTLVYYAAASSIQALPSLAKFPNVTSVQYAFAGTPIKTIPQNIFSSNPAITTTSGTFANCTSVTSSINDLLSPLVNLKNASGMFRNCSIKGTIPKGFFRNNTKLTDASIMFCLSGITGVEPLFLQSDNTVDGTYMLSNIASMFGSSKLTGNLPKDLFTGCSTIRNIGRYYGGSYAANTHYEVGGLFANTSIKDVPDKIFRSLNGVTNAQGAFWNCNQATFPQTDDRTYNFLSDYTGLTNANQMFAGCKKMILRLEDNFLPSSVTSANGTFAYTSVPNVISLKNLSNLTSAIGTFANTPISTYPEDLFEGLTNLQNVSYFFQGCIYLDRQIGNTLFKDCVNLKNTSYMFSGCENLGSSASSNTLPDGLFENNLLLQTTAGMFQYCYSMHGMIPNIFGDSVEHSQYLNLTNINRMFFRSSFIPNNDGHLFEQGLLHNLTRLETAVETFAGINRSANTLSHSASPFQLYDTDVFINSSYLQNASGIFRNANLNGTIDGNLFTYSIYSLRDISYAFALTGVTSIEDGFLVSPDTGKNYTLSNVAYAFSGTTSLTGNIPQCDDKTIFSAIKNKTDNFRGYAYNTGASNKDSFTNMWVSATGAPSGYGTVTISETVADFNASSGCLGL